MSECICNMSAYGVSATSLSTDGKFGLVSCVQTGSSGRRDSERRQW